MSLMPMLYDFMDDRIRFPTLYDQNFGLGLLNTDPLYPTSSALTVPMLSGYLRPWRNMLADESGLSSIVSDDKEFKVNLDVQQFKPEELKVTVDDKSGYLVVDGKHEEKSDQHGFISRQFTRRYKIPQNVDLKNLKSDLSTDGVLSLHAPKLAVESKGRSIPITQTKAPAIKGKKGKTEKGEKMEE